MNRPNADPHAQKSSLSVRLAKPKDRQLCSQLDGTYQTDSVWQMHLQEDEQAIRVIFNQVRLPRTMTAEYPFSPEAVTRAFEQSPNLLVVRYEDTILGCVDGSVDVSRRVFNVTHLIVHEQARRRGVGRYLLASIKQLAIQQNCHQVSIAIQTKNHPAITFMKNMGFEYCGYNDQYFKNGDIALLFTLKL